MDFKHSSPFSIWISESYTIIQGAPGEQNPGILADPDSRTFEREVGSTIEQVQPKRGQLTRLLKALGISRKKLDEYLANPFQPIPDRLVRRCEKFLNKPPAWMDEQHVETDPVCASFPEDMRRLMMIYSDLPTLERRRLLCIVEAFVGADS